MADGNKNRLLEMIQKKSPEFHPALVLAKFASDETLDPKVQLDAAKALLPYLEPQLKSVEVKGNKDSDWGLLRVLVTKEEDMDNTSDTTNDSEES